MKKGFTLVEVIVAITVISLFVFMLASVLISFLQNPKTEQASLDDIDRARMIASTFTNEVRDAVTGSDGSFPIAQASDNQIVFYSSYGAGSSVIKRIRYYVSDNDLYKGVVLPAGSPPTYNLSNETISKIFSGITNGSAPAFYYYNGDYNGTGSALIQPVNINYIRFIQMSLMIPNQIAQESSSFQVVAGATVRALKNNLGN